MLSDRSDSLEDSRFTRRSPILRRVIGNGGARAHRQARLEVSGQLASALCQSCRLEEKRKRTTALLSCHPYSISFLSFFPLPFPFFFPRNRKYEVSQVGPSFGLICHWCPCSFHTAIITQTNKQTNTHTHTHTHTHQTQHQSLGTGAYGIVW